MALDVGADGVEFDVRLSKDGVPVVIHDPTLTRTAGMNKRVSDLTAEQLSRVDAGSCFNAAHPSRSSDEFAAEGIPSLHDVLQLLEGTAGPIYVELKCDDESDVADLVESVCRVLADSTLIDRVVVESFHLAVIPRTKVVLPGVQTGALFAPKIVRMLRKEKYVINIASELGADHLCVHRSLVNRKLARKAKSNGLPVSVWTVNAARWVPYAVKRGLYALITNDPEKLLRRRGSIRRQPSPMQRAPAGTSE